ncbi:basic helix-loop-helix domain-containing protein USF3 isoform X2 [Rhinolophus ferrumequinum]|uniref:basic helix-loop-helix domain-containing protein USF3 isoform X2 n=1 Tax=Rhinolophus ferrumequinum TaxID=59479 RepID=UPI00140F77AF|nr:basic helix-loop-helix domain-containing protein USF3 isoform X2 [Rhinolophus ferrumequinum]
MRKVPITVTMPEMTENETPPKKQHRKKNRETHNAVERHRKKKINAGINRIGELIPCSPALKQSKNMILDQAFKYITELKRQNDELLLNGGNNEQAEEIKKLRKQLEEIQKENGRYIELLKANDICLYDDPTIHWKGNLKTSKVSVVIPGDQVQKNIIVYSNGSQPGGNSQGTAVQGITFNVGHNLQKQTANVVPVQRTCNLVTPVSISGVYPAENKPWHQTTVSALAANQPVPLCLPATISAQNILELSTSESESSVLGATSGSLIAVPIGPEPHQHRSLHTSLNDQNSSEKKNGQESPKLLKKTVPCATSIPSSSSSPATKVTYGGKSCLSTQDFRSDSQTTVVVSVPTTVCSQPPRSAGDSCPVSISKGADLTSITAVVAPSAPGGGKTTTPVSSLSANPLDNGWTLSCSLPSSAVSASDLKNINSLTRISSAGNTQTTWTTLQMAGNTIQPLSQTPSSAVTPVVNESGTSPTTTHHSRHVATGINLNNSFPADGQPVEQVVVTLPSCPSLPMQPLIAHPQGKSQPPKNILPLNSAMQVIQMAQPVGSTVNAAPANQNVIILQPPSTTPCPTVMRAEVPNQTVGQQIVIIQAANQNPLPLLSAPPPGSVRLPVNGANAIIGSNSVQNVSTPQTFGGKHLVHILPRPSSLSTSNSTQTFSVTMSNQQQPQTISLNGQLFALQPVMSSSGTTNQTPMQIIQPTTSEDPNTNVALNTFGALASLNQSISQMAGQSCVQLSLSQPANPQTAANSQTTPANCVSLTASVASPMTTENSATLPSIYNLVTAPSVNTVACLPNVKSKRLTKKPGVKKHLASSKSACSLNPVRDVGKADGPSTGGSAEPPCDDGLLENPPVVLPSVTMSQAKSAVSSSQPPSITSLSVNNLIHQSSVSHPLVSCAGLPQTTEQTTVPATVNLTVSSSSYGNQPPRPSLMTEYSQEQLNTLSGTIPNPQIQEPLLKPSHESRKDSAKRSVQDDLLLSSAKRQKLCQPAPLRLEGMSLMSQTPDSISDQSQMMVSQMPPNSSNSVVPISTPAHGDGLTRLFPPGNNFVAPALRQTEVQCSSQPSVAEQQQTQASQHLQALQQHVPAQGVSHLHSNHLYLKQQQQQQQQQAGQLRERHHLYQLQHHISHAETSVHSQPHNVHQQRTLQQEVQMQKKRNLVQATQASQLSLQSKHHGTDQSRPKSGQPHPHHQQMQPQMQQHFGSSQPEKSCDNPSTSRNHHNHPQNHLSQDIMHQQQDIGNRQQGSGVSSEHVSGHNPMQRLLTSRGIEQQMVSQPSIVTRPSDMTCTPHRPERNRVSSYSAEALIGKTSSNSEQRMGILIQGSRVSDQLEMRSYIDVPRNKSLAIHNMQGRVDHTVASEIRLSDCQTFKPSGASQQPPSNFEVQSSRNNEIGNPVSSLRSMQSQAFRISQNPGPPPIDRQKRLPYPPVQSIPTGNAVPPRDSENTCHQSFMQSLLAPHLGDQVIGSQRSLSEHQRNTQCGPSPAIEYNCPPTHEGVHIRRETENQNRESCDMSLGAINTRNSTLNIPFSSSSSSGDIQGRNTSPNVSVQKSNPMRITDSHGAKGHMNPPVTTNMHGVARPALPHPPVSHGNADQGPPVRQTNSSVPQRSRHPLQDSSGSKIRQPERNRSGNQRHTNVFDPSLPHLPLSTSGSMILGRQQPTTEKRGSIVRFMPDSPQVPNENSAPDQHTLSQNFGFPFIPEGGMNPPINANTSFIPQVTQPSATRTPALIPVDPQNTLPSFYPPYSPAHPTLSNDISIPYFSNQMFSNPSTEKVNSGSLNNRFGSILSPPRPVGFAQPSFPLLPDMPPMHMTNSHLSNFNMTSLFPEIATALPDGSAMSPLLTIANSSASDSSKQSSNRPAHNISHILGHDCSSAV